MVVPLLVPWPSEGSLGASIVLTGSTPIGVGRGVTRRCGCVASNDTLMLSKCSRMLTVVPAHVNYELPCPPLRV